MERRTLIDDITGIQIEYEVLARDRVLSRRWFGFNRTEEMSWIRSQAILEDAHSDICYHNHKPSKPTLTVIPGGKSTEAP